MMLENVKLGPYQLVSLIGKGGMAEVWLANQLAFNRQVAVKVIPRLLAGSDESRSVERFCREAQVIASLNHPNIIPVYDFGQTQDYFYMVMPYMQGGSLLDLLKREPVTCARAIEIFSQIL